MNDGSDVYHALTPEGRERRLRRSGIAASLVFGGGTLSTAAGNRPTETGILGRGVSGTAASAKEHYRQRYLVKVYNLTPLEITPLGAGRGMKSAAAALTARPRPRSSSDRVSAEGPAEYARLPFLERGSLPKRLGRLAAKALYCLGLDSGEVLLAAQGERRYTVEGIMPLESTSSGVIPEPYRSAEAALQRALKRERPGRPDLVMGMDPEFLLLRDSTGRVVPASRYLPADGVAGCDAGPPGTRGAFPVAELRPRPRGEPRALLAQLRSAAMEADRLIADRSISWRAGGMPLRGWALGGHLHFSGVTLTAPLLRALDNYLALPIALLEDARAGGRRPRYGVLGDFRLQPHGGFEYRTLPSFLVSPVVARGAVTLAHLIVSHYEDLPLRPLDREDLHAAYYSGDKPPLRAAFAPLKAQLRALAGYAAAADAIEPLLRHIDAGRSWDETRNVRRLWCGEQAP
ncbi:Phage phiEco32-like COOH.NH2 ligase-type 2 [Paenibacillus sophorae]|nr:Phage phiEco32-like COOH.NH2 ligase-type 2 [Paenibacillus sophorae]